MEIKSKLTEKDFIKVQFVMFYQKTSMKVLIGIAVLMFLISVYSNLVMDIGGKSQWIVALGFLIVWPAMIYFNAKKQFSTNQRLSEVIQYNFDDDSLEINGESFQNKQTWDKVYKVTKTKSWIFIWHSTQVANLIPRRDVWEGDLEGLKHILNSKGVKNNL